MQDSTRIIRSTLTRSTAGEPMHAGPVFAAPFHAPGDPAGVQYTYGRAHNPTWTTLERAIGRIEAGEDSSASAVVFASGMAACTAVFGVVLRPGDAIVLPSNAYFAARVLLEDYFGKMGVELRAAPTAGNAQAALLGGAKLLWLETPSNPTMEICDIRALSEAAHAAGALVAVDNTTATPLGQRVLELGADFAVSSDTKLMTGHSDILLGHVAVRDQALCLKLAQWRTLTGSVPGPMEAWLATRSLATLPLRLERSCANAQSIAEFLAGRSEVYKVYFPGLPSHPAHDIAKKQMRCFGPVLGFELRDQAAAETFLRRAELVTEATSFGGITTTAERRARWGHDDISECFIRMSVGCEAVEDLIADLSQALAAASR